MRLVAPVEPKYDPKGHANGSNDGSGQYRPWGQIWHAVIAVELASEYLPLIHAIGALPKLGQYDPGGHVIHADFTVAFRVSE